MISLSDMTSLRVSLASPELIRSWSYGEVTKPETINYRTLKPEKDGLFCERIFGPTKSWTCACGKYKRVRFKGIICEKCGVAVTHARVRRERMGHIELAVPVSHPWYSRGAPSRMALLLNLTPRRLGSILYYVSYVVIAVDEQERTRELECLDEERERIAQGAHAGEKDEDGEMSSQERSASLARVRHALETAQKMDLLDVELARELTHAYGHVVRIGTGAGAVRELLGQLDLDEIAVELREQLEEAEAAVRKKVVRRLKIVEALRSSHASPAWMILTALPVLPPDLRPVLQLGNARFASADANALYVSVINRNNRLKHLQELGAPEIILNFECAKLQRACDALFDNARMERPLLGPTKQPLKSLSDTLRGKEGRFRRNLLGKRVDYSGRSVIVVGPQLKMHQCGLPKKIALELFKPFVIGKVLAYGFASSLRAAKRYVEHRQPAVWDILEEEMRGHLVLLNRAPTLHRLSIQAFEPVLIEGDAIQLPALVTSAFNADFDGDQMAIHLPLSAKAQEEARTLLFTRRNILHPATGDPVLSLSQDMVLGCYYLTQERPNQPGEGHAFVNSDEALLAHQSGSLGLQAPIWIRLADEEVYDTPPPDAPILRTKGTRVKTTVGRIIFNEILPERLRFRNYAMTKQFLKQLVAECYKECGRIRTAELADEIKRTGFSYATKSGVTFSIFDVDVPKEKSKVLAEADAKIAEQNELQASGLITEEEHYQQSVIIWNEATDAVTALVRRDMDPYGNIATISNSGATKAGFQQIRQLCGMRGLMASPSGRIIAIPVRGNFLEGLSIVEYFISSHGARKGFMDRSLNTHVSGYLFIRLVNAVQAVIVTEEDCGTREYLLITEEDSRAMGLPNSRSRLIGRVLARSVPGVEFLTEGCELNEDAVDRLIREGVQTVPVRSVLGCQAHHGICRACYGQDLSTRSLVHKGVAAGIIAAQSIGEPSTQLTMRTFHTGGVAGVSDITQGLPRVEELFEAHVPKEKAILSEIAGVVDIVKEGGEYTVRVTTPQSMMHCPIPPRARPLVASGDQVEKGQVIALLDGEDGELTQMVRASFTGRVHKEDSGEISIHVTEREERIYTVPTSRKLVVTDGQQIIVGAPITTGPLDPQEILRTVGKDAVQQYLVNEVRGVYRATGVYIHDKHFEVIVREMLRHVQVEDAGDTRLLPSAIVDRFDYADICARVLAEGGEPAEARTVLLGLTKTALASPSWLAAASFQEATRVLTDAVLEGQTDHIEALKENVMLGRLIPAGTGFRSRK